jgi:ABC-type antimicrobial peptide transport system permease subunit
VATIPISYSVRNLWTRRVTTLLTAGGIALVIFVFAAVLMLAHGLERTLVATGRDDNAIAIRRGAEAEMMSLIGRDVAGILKAQPEIPVGSDGRSLAAAETVVLVSLPKRGSGQPGLVQTRGVAPESFAIRPQIRIVAGRPLTPGLSEIVVGAAAARRFQGLGLGETVRFSQRGWTVVGIFEADGSGFESEIWADGEQLLQAFRRPVYSSVTLRLADPAAFDRLKQRLDADRRLNLELAREKRFYSEQSAMMASFIRALGIFVTLIFSLGAMIGAMITMYSAVANRTVEIGTLRALGFGRWAILAAFLGESLLLSLAGGLVGLALAAMLNAVTFSTTNFATFSELAFRFTLSPAIALQALAFALIMGGAGGALPALHAARQDIVSALRAV